MNNILNIYVISDSTGETGENYALSLISQFPNVENKIERFSDIDTTEKVDNIFKKINDNKSIIITTISNDDLREYTKKLSEQKSIEYLDILGRGIEVFEKVTNEKALKQIALTRKLNDTYFNMIEAVEFAVKYDDGKDYRGLIGADIVLLGVSRTSKTPLSMLLATKNYKVCNLPLVPEIKLPNEIFEIDNKKIIGLIINPDKLYDMREIQHKNFGLSSKGLEYQKNRIKEELTYAKEVFDDLDCYVIDVSNLTIEQTATKIIEYYNLNYK